ncbi:MAG: hypothetical protein K2W86_04045 [Sphingomonas sp.]|nr:hypothetical protein [Sphingomonas sp.]
MDQVFFALAEALVPWVEERYGKPAAILAAVLLVVTTMLVLAAVAVWLLR